jgi:5,10-methenyltetrahydrofolate synthetase
VKKNLRDELLLKLSSLSFDEFQSLSFKLTNQLIKFLTYAPELQSQVGAAYLPLRAEIAPAYQELLKAVPCALSFPILFEGEMLFGIPNGMPKGETWLEPPYVPADPEWLLVPGVGFDLSGARLGRGKGFYDRYLTGKDSITIGLAWTEQIVSKIPVEKHDCHMDFIITEEYCWDVGQQEKF